VGMEPVFVLEILFGPPTWRLVLALVWLYVLPVTIVCLRSILAVRQSHSVAVMITMLGIIIQENANKVIFKIYVLLYN